MKVVAGGQTDDREGWFVRPTLLTTEDPMVRHMRDEFFGPIVTLHVYPDSAWDDTLELVDRTSPYALTGAVFARDRAAIVEATNALRDAAGNFYINDKPTGAVVGQQPFGGARASGTDDKAGSPLNLLRWVARAHDQGDVRAADRLPLPVPRRSLGIPRRKRRRSGCRTRVASGVAQVPDDLAWSRNPGAVAPASKRRNR